MKKKINKPYVKQVQSRASAHGWVDVKDSLPETDANVLCMMEYEGGDIFPVIRWISGYDDVITDENGFALYPAEVKVVAWMEIPEYNRQRTNEKDTKDKEKRHYLAVLLQHNRWRRDEHVPNTRKMVNPTELGKAIDYAIQYIKEK